MMEPGEGSDKFTLCTDRNGSEQKWQRRFWKHGQAYVTNGLANECDTQRHLLHSDDSGARGNTGSVIATGTRGCMQNAQQRGRLRWRRVARRRHLCSRIVNYARSRVTRLVFVARSSAKQVPLCGNCMSCGRRGLKAVDCRDGKKKGHQEAPNTATSLATFAGSIITLLVRALTRETNVVGMHGWECLEP